MDLMAAPHPLPRRTAKLGDPSSHRNDLTPAEVQTIRDGRDQARTWDECNGQRGGGSPDT